MREEGEDPNRSADFRRVPSRGAALRVGPAACRGLVDTADNLASRLTALKSDLDACDAAYLATLLTQCASMTACDGHESDDGLAEEMMLAQLIERALDLGATCRDAIPAPEPIIGIDDFNEADAGFERKHRNDDNGEEAE